jgi:hypothetical protein
MCSKNLQSRCARGAICQTKIKKRRKKERKGKKPKKRKKFCRMAKEREGKKRGVTYANLSAKLVKSSFLLLHGRRRQEHDYRKAPRCCSRQASNQLWQQDLSLKKKFSSLLPIHLEPGSRRGMFPLV